DDFAQRIADSIAAHDPRWVTIYGARIDIKPAVIIYPDSFTIAEFQANATDSGGRRIGGYYSNEVGMSVQKLMDLEPSPENVGCFWEAPLEARTMQWRTDTTISIISHEFTHIYQNALAPGAGGLVWVYEGQAEWIENSQRLHEERMRRYAATGADLPALTEQASYYSTAADGCYRLAYSMGATFYNFLYHNYGGIDAVAFVVQLWADGAPMTEAVEALADKPFIDVQNEWRVSLGFPALTAADLDPSLALLPYEDSLLVVGETVTLPAMPPLVKMGSAPGEGVMPGPQCFANTPVEILRMGTLDDIAYFEIDCMGMIGWVTRDQIVGP
ncbi:MAG: hypothetical protein K8S97_06065, partial [Anaerolineae bacterium]|nr:hypothetical protein [Anaerolineae bacterium]